MSEEDFSLSFVFREGASPAEIQLLLSYIAEILKEMQIAESEEENESSALCESINDTTS